MSEDAIRAGENTPQFREMMQFEVERARVNGLPKDCRCQAKWTPNSRSISSFSAAAVWRCSTRLSGKDMLC